MSPSFWKVGARGKECRYVPPPYGGDNRRRSREVNSLLSEDPRGNEHARVAQGGSTAHAEKPAPRATGRTAHAPGSGDAPVFFSSEQVSGGFSFPPSRPASCLARPQGVAMGTKRPQLACGGAACLVAFADLVAATVGAHGAFG